LTKIYLFGQRKNMGGGTHLVGFVDAIKSLGDNGEVIQGVYAICKEIGLAVKKINKTNISVFPPHDFRTICKGSSNQVGYV
jgi:hypothetical protein